MQPKFSIIIPHYNIPDLLMRCLKSIPVSEDIQVIVVDDNSPDADTYLERYSELSRPYLEFIRTTIGGGAGYARNVGLDRAIGKWLLFADADDLFVDDMYHIINQYVNSEAEIVYFKNRAVLSNDIDKPIRRAEYVNKHIDEYLKTGYDKYVRLRLVAPWGKLIRRDLVEAHSLRFDETKYANDYYFSVCTGYCARQIEASECVLYIYTSREDSLTGTFCSKPGELAIRSEVSFRVEKLLKQLDVDNEPRPFKMYLYKMLHHDRALFRYYFFRLPEIYPSIPIAIHSLCQGKGVIFTVKLYLYSFWLWIRR